MKTVMIVDDIQEQREILKHYLDKHFDIIQASSGREAVVKLEHKKVDLIISDIKMPNGDGFWLLNYIKQKPSVRIPIIIVSGDSTTEEVLSAGATLFFPKPYSVRLLCDSVCEILQP